VLSLSLLCFYPALFNSLQTTLAWYLWKKNVFRVIFLKFNLLKIQKKTHKIILYEALKKNHIDFL